MTSNGNDPPRRGLFDGRRLPWRRSRRRPASARVGPELGDLVAAPYEGPPIVVAPLMALPIDLTAHLPHLVRGFRRDAVVYPLDVDLAPAYDPDRDQYLSSQLLRALLDARPPGAGRIVGVVDVDLFVPVLTYVFGEAQLGGRAAIVSTFRLREPWLRGGATPELLRVRLVKTLFHEIGHTQGLRHCPDPGCVMASASSLEMLDEKGESFCLECLGRLAEAHAS